MKRRELSLQFPDFWLTIAREAKKEAGEDCFCRYFCRDAGLVGVFDGCGGLGAQRRLEYSQATEAYVASRLCAGAFYNAFEDTFAQGADNQGLDGRFYRYASENCFQVLSDYRPTETSAFAMRGSMVKTLPTTAASALILRSPAGYWIAPIWAGDSRVYLLDEQGLAQLTQDDTSVPDPMDNLYEDGILQNVLCAGKKPEMHRRKLEVRRPFMVFAATDGCFGYFTTPMEFEGALLHTLLSSRSVAEWEERLSQRIGEVAGDDYTLVMASYGFGDFSRLQKAMKGRWEVLESEQLRRVGELHPDDRASRQALWKEYAPNYMRYMGVKG